MITRNQVKDIYVLCLAKFLRVSLGFYWTMDQKMDLIEAEEIAKRAYREHGR